MTARRVAAVGAVFFLWALSCSHAPDTVRTAEDGLLREYPRLAKRKTTASAEDSAPKPIAAVQPVAGEEELSSPVSRPSTSGELAAVPSVDEIENSGFRDGSVSLGTLSVLVRGKKSKRCAVNVAGAKLGKAPLKSMEVEPGLQKIVVSCGKKRIAHKTVEISAGEHETLIFNNADFRRGKGRRRN